MYESRRRNRISGSVEESWAETGDAAADEDVEGFGGMELGAVDVQPLRITRAKRETSDDVTAGLKLRRLNRAMAPSCLKAHIV